jgi:hypothetical protein
VDHLPGDDDGGVARHEHHPAPPALAHARQIPARETDAGEHVDLPVAPPRVVVDLEHGLRLEDAEVVDEDVDVGERGRHRLGPRGGRDVGGDAVDPRVRPGGAELVDDPADAILAAAVDRRRSARLGEARRDHPPDALRRPADERGPSGEIDLHASAVYHTADGASSS